MPTNDFLPLGVAGGSNVESQALWSTDTIRMTGLQSGIVSSAALNKALRQATSVAAMIGQYINTYVAVNATDDGNITNLVSNFNTAVGGSISGTIKSGTDTGAANAYVVTTSPTIVSLTQFTTVVFKANNANTMASTINVDGFGVTQIVNTAQTALSANQIVHNGIYVVVFDGTYWQLASGTGTVVQAIPGTTFNMPVGSAAINVNDVVEV